MSVHSSAAPVDLATGLPGAVRGFLSRLRPAEIIGWSTGLLLLLTILCVSIHGPKIAKAQAPATPSSAQVTPASIAIAVEDKQVIVSGILPKEQAKRLVMSHVTKTFPSVEIVDRVKVDLEVDEVKWGDKMEQLLPVIKNRVQHARLQFDGRVLMLRGQTLTEEVKTNLLRQIFKITGSELTVNDQLVVAARVAAPLSVAAGRLQARINDELQGKTIEFASSSADIKPHSKKLLDTIAGHLKEEALLRVEIAGHTDSKGDKLKNDKLSQRRADAVKRYLESRGIKAERLRALGYGSSKPIADESTPSGQQQNRRIEFHVVE